MRWLVVGLAGLVIIAMGMVAVAPARLVAQQDEDKAHASDDWEQPANLTVSLEQPPLTIRSGQRLVYTFKVENKGPAVARNVRLYGLPGPEVRSLYILANGAWDDCEIAHASRGPTLECVQAFMPKGWQWVIWVTEVTNQRAGTLINIKGAVLGTTTEYNWIDNIMDFSTVVTD